MDSWGISGLYYEPDFISEIDEEFIINEINNSEWSDTLSRRTQQYGYKYNYKKYNAEKIIPLPEWANVIIDKLIKKDLINKEPDQLIVNEYLPGQGIAAHKDSTLLFDDKIIVISLGSDIGIKFTSDYLSVKSTTTYIKQRSLYMMTGDSRYKFTHEIKRRKVELAKNTNGEEHKITRKTRISLTFRYMIKN